MKKLTKTEMRFDSKAINRNSLLSLVLSLLLIVPVFLSVNTVGAQGEATLIVSQTGEAPGEGFIPILSTSYYDTTVTSVIFNGLSMRNDTVLKTMVPALASGTMSAPGWSVSADSKTWTVKLRSGVTWHDGQSFNATDVKFTFDSLQNSTLAAPTMALFLDIIGGKNNVVVLNSTAVRFDLPVPYAYFVENVLTVPILPWHILKGIPYNSTSGANWRNTSYNTGQGGPGPVGTGPYKWVSYNPQTLTVQLTRNDNYFDFPEKGKAALLARGQFTVKNYYVRQIIGTDAAITAISNGEVNVLDSQFHLELQKGFLQDWGNSSLAIYDAFGVQEMGVNMRHPILGTGVDTPLGQSQPSQAALAAKYVRQAISYAVPRDNIIGQLLNGYGNPAITTPIVGNYRTGAAVTEGFNAALKPYDFNLTRSKELLQAAGYTLPATEGGLLTPNLKITLLAPTANDARRAWSSIITTNLRGIGIDASKVELPFSPNIFARALTPSAGILGKTFEQGGFDILFVGYNLGIDADPFQLYHGTQLAPTGGNYYLWENSQNDALSRQIKETVDKPTRLDLVKQWQELARDELPSIPILYTREIVAFDNTVTNGRAIFNSYSGPTWPPIPHLTVTAQAGGFFGAYGLPILIGVIVAVVAVVAAFYFLRMRKPKTQTTPAMPT